MDFDIITENLKKGFDHWKDNLVAYLVAMIISIVVGSIIGSIASVFGLFGFISAILSGSFAGMGMAFVGMIISLVLVICITAPLDVGLVYMAIKGTRGEKVEITDVFYAFKSMSVYIRTLIFIVVFFVLLGIFSIIPFIGTLIFMILFIYTVFIYIMTPSEGIVYALKESFNIAKDNLVMTIIALLVVLVLNFIGSIPFGLGLFITVPISFIFITYILKELKPDIKDDSGL